MTLNNTETGWVIINIGHPTTGSKYIVSDSFRATKQRAIDDFIKASGSDWKYWRNKFNFRAVRADITIKTV